MSEVSEIDVTPSACVEELDVAPSPFNLSPASYLSRGDLGVAAAFGDSLIDRSLTLLSDAAGLPFLDVDCVEAADASPFAAWA
jgi:hypothetical protein